MDYDELLKKQEEKLDKLTDLYNESKDLDHYEEYSISSLADQLIEETRQELGYSSDLSDVDPFERYKKTALKPKAEAPKVEAPVEPEEDFMKKYLIEEEDFDPFHPEEKQKGKKKLDTKKQVRQFKSEEEWAEETPAGSGKKTAKKIGLVLAAVVLVLAIVVGVFFATGKISSFTNKKLVVEQVDAAFNGTGINLGDPVSINDFSVIATYEGGETAALKENEVTLSGPDTYEAGETATFTFTCKEDETITDTVTLELPDWNYFDSTQTAFTEKFWAKAEKAGIEKSSDYSLTFVDASSAGADQFTKVKLTGGENSDQATLEKLQKILIKMTLPKESTMTAAELLSALKENPESVVKTVRYSLDDNLNLIVERDNSLDTLAASGSETVAENLDSEEEDSETADSELTEENTGVYIRFTNPKQVSYHISYSDNRSSSDVTVLDLESVSVKGYTANEDGTYNALIAVTYQVTGNVVDGDPYGFLKISGPQSDTISMTDLSKGKYYTKVYTFENLEPGDYTVTVTGASHTYTSTSVTRSSSRKKTTSKTTTTTEKNTKEKNTKKTSDKKTTGSATTADADTEPAYSTDPVPGTPDESDTTEATQSPTVSEDA